MRMYVQPKSPEERLTTLSINEETQIYVAPCKSECNPELAT
jgi:hypothetical protein